ncbi:MAG TPA: PHP domain-containing protein [Methanomassiliicoccales archaeon]|nr:PHP domain-containing protein [Methanomassiliicoccales archaeon]
MGADSLINLHTHSVLSDGDFRPEQILERAASDGLTHVALTDHFETIKVRSLRSSDLGMYINLIRTLGEKYGNGIRAMVGLEIDTNPARCDLWNLPFAEMEQLDLVLFEYVADDMAGGLDLERFAELRSRFDGLCGLAHSDISRIFGSMSPGEVADLLQDMEVFVEINTAHPYVRDGARFFDLAEPYYKAFQGKVKVSIGTDAHHTISEVSNLDEAYGFLRRAGLENDLLF